MIIGAGASGLMAARELAKAGKKVCVLEARDHIGGRTHTLYNVPLSPHVEMGAEFVHGHLPITLELLKEAGIPYHRTGGEMWRAKDGELKQEDYFIDHWHLFEKKLEETQEDITLNAFLAEHFADEKYDELRDSVRRFATGFDTADPDRASLLALKEEWLDEDEQEQYRIDNGYGALIQFLAQGCIAAGGMIHTSTVVKEIMWQDGKATAIADNGITYTANKVIVTVPLGVLQAEDDLEGAITFSPALTEQKNAARQMGFGAIIKVLLQFTEAFWEKEPITTRAGSDLKQLNFLFSKEHIPTWWTQYPNPNALLTGWLGGPEAAKLKGATDEEILTIATKALSNIFSMEEAAIKKLIAASYIVNWTAEPFTRGSYAYDTVESKAAREVLMRPVSNTIYFAGEALYSGPVMGTVEAALTSAREVVQEILSEGKR